MRKTILICPLILLFFVSACEKVKVKGDNVILYKTKGDYTKNVFVTLSQDGEKLTHYPSVGDIDTIRLPIQLTHEFMVGTGLNGENGIHSVVTSLTIFNYLNPISADSLFKLIIDFDPFIEYYISFDNVKRDYFFNDAGIDTAKINEIILNNEINKYFKKLK